MKMSLSDVQETSWQKYIEALSGTATDCKKNALSHFKVKRTEICNIN